MHIREIILVCILIGCLSSSIIAESRVKAKIRPLNDNDIKNEWSTFKSKHSKLFRSTVAEQARYDIKVN